MWAWIKTKFSFIFMISRQNFKSSKTLTIPEFQNIQSLEISFAGSDKPVFIRKQPAIYDIYNILENEATYITSSVNDSPIHERTIKVKPYTSNNEDNFIIYLYQTNHKCYIEQSYTGIFEISRISYEKMLVLFSSCSDDI